MRRVTDPLSQHRRALRRRARAGGCRSRSSARRTRCRSTISAAGAVGAGEVGGAAGRAQHAGRDHRDRAAGDARPHRADARPFRRDGARSSRREGGGKRITLIGQPELTAGADRRARPTRPRPPFPLVAALLVPGSEITVEGVGAQPARAPGCSRRLARDGRRHRLSRTSASKAASRSPICVVRAGALKGVDVPAERAPTMIDEYPDPRRRRRLRRGPHA